MIWMKFLTDINLVGQPLIGLPTKGGATYGLDQTYDFELECLLTVFRLKTLHLSDW